MTQGLGLSFKRSFATFLFPRYSRFLDQLNWTARWNRTVRENSGCPRFDTREEMYSYLSHEFFADGGKAIDYFEFGVHRGDSLRTWTTLNGNPQTRFFGFDSFEGLPEDWNEKKTKGTFGTGGKTPDIADPRVQFVVGWFQNVVPGFLRSYEPKNPLVLHNDSDLYSSTLYCLTAMNSLMPRETIVIFDEFYDALHEYRALIDYASAYMRQFKIVAATRRFDQVAVAIL